MITFNRLHFFFNFLQVNLGWGLLPTSNPWFTRDITVICTQNPGLGQFLYKNGIFHNPWFTRNHDLPVITHVLKRGFEPPNCADIFHTSFWHFISKKAMDAQRSRTIKIGQSHRKSRTYQPTTSTYLVDLQEQQPAQLQSAVKRAKPGFTMFYHVLPGKTGVYNSRLEISRFWKGRVYNYICGLTFIFRYIIFLYYYT